MGRSIWPSWSFVSWMQKISASVSLKSRLSYRMEWEDAFLAYLKKLEDDRPVIVSCYHQLYRAMVRPGNVRADIRAGQPLL